MHDQEARAILEARAAAGGRLVLGQESDWASIKRLRDQCLEAGIPAALESCAKG